MKIKKLYRGKVWLVYSLLLLSVLLVSSVLTACAKPAAFSTETVVKPEDVGLSSEKLNEIDTAVQADMAANKVNGTVILIARDGKVAYFKNFGYRDNDKKSPMEKDSIFRILSMTKSFTAVSTAMLQEEGKLSFQDPVEKYIPSFKDIQVGDVSKDANGNNVVTTRPPTKVMTVLDLATHTSGITGLLIPAPGINDLFKQAGLDNTSGLTSAELCDKLATVPLVFDPGTKYLYGSSYDVLGRVVEVASGMTLDKFFEERIFKPLGMKDTGYRIPADKVGRLAELNPKSPFNSDVNDPNRKLISGSYGCVSTAADYARFAQMLLNGGELDGKRLLKPETVAYITSDLIGPLGNRTDPAYGPGKGYGVGFDFYVRVDTTGVDFPANIGEFCKDGIMGTVYWVDPKEKLIAVGMPGNRTDISYRTYFRGKYLGLIYNALIKQ